jgi:ATP/maltotriose-dependent transcriptional regulator MalT
LLNFSLKGTEGMKCERFKMRGRIISEKNGNLKLREREILIRMASGCNNRTISGDLRISPHPVKANIFNPLGLYSPPLAA